MKTMQPVKEQKPQATNDIEKLFTLAKELSMTVEELNMRLCNKTPLNTPRMNFERLLQQF